ncbi:MAG: hypothetical protein KKG10_20080, partial [Proteobacteria bacterium]|nr:hypothetical protein [Pseudomonadota bacterium]
RPLKMTFDDQLKALVFFHLEEHVSGQHLLQVLEEDDFARDHIAPEEGIKKSSFAEAINSRGLEQLMYVYQNLQTNAVSVLPKEHADLGDLIGIDGSLIDACLSMHWADYRKGSKKAKVHLGFDLNRSIVDSLSIFPIKYRDKIPKEPDKFKAPLAEVDSSLPPGYPCSRGSLPSVSVSPGLVDQIAFEDQVRPNCFFLSEVGLLQ